MTVPTDRTEARRASLLNRVFRLVGNPRFGKAPEGESTILTSSPQSGGIPRDEERSGRAGPPENRLYLEARRQIKRRAWGHAQRALEEVAKRDLGEPADLDLKSVRSIRRSLHRAARWPSDVDAHLDLGRAYFDLDMGDDALAEFALVQRIAPQRYEAFALSTLEFLYRGEYTRAVSDWDHARRLNAELPELEEVMSTLPRR